MNTDAGPSALPRLPSSTWTSKVSFSPSSLAAFSTTTTSATDEPSLLNTEAVALGGSLAKLPVRQISTISGVAMWPTVRTGRLVNKVAVGSTPSRINLSPSRRPALALSTISADEYRLLVGTPIALGPAATAVGAVGAGAGVWATAYPEARIKAAAIRLHVCCAFIGDWSF